jgi:poly-gamma-glutamate capsule biosynthesis protein CapA/YwtB (metallophosphatase superfamily)
MLLLLAAALFIACGPTAPQANLPGWQELYRRAGWQGGAALDLRAVGDVMLARHVGELAARDGPAAPFAEVGDLLAGDLVLGNLESPLTSRRDAVRPGPYRLLADPALAPTLASVGFDALGLANNHALDAGPAGLADSLAALHAVGVAPLGAGAPQATALTSTILRVGGLRVALLAFNDVLDPSDGDVALAPADDPLWANPDFVSCGLGCPAGRAWLSPAALEAVGRARASADAVVVLVHWGVEYAAEPSARQRAWAARLVAAGADLVLGAHPHVTQPAELVTAGDRTGFVAYSLGNFIFDGPPDPAQNSGMVLRVLLDKDGVALVETPRRGVSTIWAWDGAAGQPVPIPPGLELPAHPTRLPADLRGNATPLWAELGGDGVITLRDGERPDAPVVWQNEAPAWRFTRIDVGDPNDDGRQELIMLLWQPDPTGRLRSQPYLLGWRGGRFQIIWGGSATATPIQDLAAADLDGDGRSELAVLEGGQVPGDPGQVVSVWHWHGWGFQREWAAPPGSWRSLSLADIDGDRRLEIIATP